MDLMTMKRMQAGCAERGDTRPPRVRVEDAIEAANKLLNSNAKAKAIDPNENAVANFGDDSSPVANIAQAKADLAKLRDCNGTIGVTTQV